MSIRHSPPPSLRPILLAITTSGTLLMAEQEPAGPSETLKDVSRYGQQRDLMGDAYLFSRMDLSLPGLEKIKAAVAAEDYQAAWLAWRDHFIARKTPRWLIEPATYAQVMAQHYPAFREAWIRVADEICQGRVRDGELEVPMKDGRADWAAAPKRRLQHYGMGVRYLCFVFLRPLARAYVLTGKEKYAESFVNYYLAYDRYKRAENKFHELWIGIRVPVLFEAYLLLRSSPHMTPKAHRVMLRDVYWMTRWLSDFYTKKGKHYVNPTPNQTVPGASWLIQAGIMLPEFREAPRWIEQGKPKIEKILKTSVYPDGGHVETCTQYHKTVMRDVSATCLVMERNLGTSYFTSEPGADRFREMYRWLASIVTPDGFTPALNSAVYGTDWLVHLMVGNRYFRDPEMEWLLEQHYSKNYVSVQKKEMGLAASLLNEDCAPRGRGVKAKRPATMSRNLPESGFAVLRDSPDRKALYMVLDYGHPVGSHAYPSRLSFVLWGSGQPLALQPGSPFWYHDPMYRKWFHTTLSHNTVIVNGRSHEARIPGKGNVKGKLRAWSDGHETVAVSASHDGYRAPAGVVHTRAALLAHGKYFFVHDVLAPGREGNRYEWSFHSPLTLQPTAGKTVGTSEGPGVLLVPARPAEVERVRKGRGPCMIPVQYADDLNIQKRDIDYVNLEKRDRGEGASYGVLLLPYETPPEEVSVRPLQGTVSRAKAEAFEITLGKSRDIVAFCRDRARSVAWDGLQTDAAILRVIDTGKSPSFCLVDGKRLTWRGTDLLGSDQRISVEIRDSRRLTSGIVETTGPAHLRLLCGPTKAWHVNGKQVARPGPDGYATLQLPSAGRYEIVCRQ